VADWVAISSIATAGGTLVLAGATFASVRSANRAARTAERSLLAGFRPFLAPSRLDDRPQKIHFADGKWLVAAGGGGAASATDGAVYLAFAVRNVGNGIAVLHGWWFTRGRVTGAGSTHAPLESFQRLTRDIYVPPSDVGFWQGTFRDEASPEFAQAKAAVEAREEMTVDVLYGDHEGGQRVITRFLLTPRSDGDGWMAVVGRHWNIDRADPR
jgi:hypothetical protein